MWVHVCYLPKQQQIPGICSTLSCASLCLIAFMSVMSESETLTSIAGVIINSSDRSRRQIINITGHYNCNLCVAVWHLVACCWCNEITYFVCEKDVWHLDVYDRTIVFQRLYITGTTEQSSLSESVRRKMFCSLTTQTVMLPYLNATDVFAEGVWRKLFYFT